MTRIFNRTDLENTLFGYVAGDTIQNKRKRDTLEKQFDYENRGVLSRKEFVFLVLQEGYRPEKEEDYTYYSTRIDGYTKPRTLYTLAKGNSYYEVTKTEYDYSIFLIENGFLDMDKAIEFIQQEKEQKRKRLQLQKEKEEKERLEREEKNRIREEERKQRIEQYNMKHMKLGKEFLQRLGYDPIKQLLDKYVPKYIELDEKENNRTVPEEDIRAFYDSWYERLTIIIGDYDYCNHTIKQYAKNHQNGNFRKWEFRNISLFLEQQLLLSVYSDINFNDHLNTINAKMKTVYYGGEYKGKQPIKEHTFYYSIRGKNGLIEFVETRGQKLNMEGFTCYIRTTEENSYTITEESTGMSIGGVFNNKQEAIQQARKQIRENKDKVKKVVDTYLRRNGGTPLYKNNK